MPAVGRDLGPALKTDQSRFFDILGIDAIPAFQLGHRLRLLEGGDAGPDAGGTGNIFR